MATRAPVRSVAIDVLRGIAVAMVMAAHLPFSHSGLGSTTAGGVFPPAGISEVLGHGHYGVQLFLVISGYCIHMRWARHGDLSARLDFFAFWRRRLTRLYPPYLVILALSVAVTLLAARFFPASVPAVSKPQLFVDILVLLLLVQNLTDASARVGNPPFWSLALEEQLYLLYFPLLALRRALGWRATLGVPLVVTLGWFALGAMVPTSWEQGWYRAGPAYWFAWTLGALAAEAHVGLVTLPRWSRSWWTFVVLAGLAVFVKKPLQLLLVTISFFFLLSGAIAREAAGWPFERSLAPFVRLGKISYGVYLVHNVAFIVAKRGLVTFGAPAPLTLALRAAAGIAAGYVVYRIVEVPFLRLSQQIKIPFHRATRARPQSPSAVRSSNES